MGSFFLSLLWAWLVGGVICIIAQLLIDYTAMTPARILVLYVVAGVLLGAVGLFTPLKNFAGAGAGVPLVGFGGTIAEGTRKAVDETGLLGALTGRLWSSATSPPSSSAPNRKSRTERK